MGSTPRSSPNKPGERRGSTGSQAGARGPRNPPNEGVSLPVTEEFYNSRMDPVTFIRWFGYLSVVFYFFLVFVSKRTKNPTSPLYLAFNSFHNRVMECYLVVLDLYKRCPAVTGTIKKLRFELPYFMKIFSLYVPKYERNIMYLNNFNTLNNWVSLFVTLTFAFLMELLVTIVDNMVISYKSKNSLRYCTNMVHPSKFHDRSFTQQQVDKLLLSREYADLKKSRHGLGPEAWNWQLRRTLKNTKDTSKSHQKNVTVDESDFST